MKFSNKFGFTKLEGNMFRLNNKSIFHIKVA